MSSSFAIAAEDDPLTVGVIGSRVIAWLIDAVLVSVIVSVLTVFLFLFGLLTFGLGMALLALLPAVPAVYHVLFLAGGGAATPGQRLMGLVVRRANDLGPPTLLQAILTTAGLAITLATGVVWLAVAFFTVRRRTLHDMVAGLVVVNARALASLRFSPA